MALSVVTNVASLNAQRNLVSSGKMLAKSLERLSSGLRINRAADDAAGLAISESLRAQIRGLNQAVRNANDGVSLVNTAEGAVVETTNMLQRMRELAVQAASDTNSATNRASLQEEVNQLVDEITRIGNTVQFNGLKLLDGSFQSKNLQIGSGQGEILSIGIGDLRSTQLGKVYEDTSAAVVPTTAYTNGDISIRTSDGTETAVNLVSGYTDGVSDTAAAYSAIAYATYVNAISGTTGVTATVQSHVKTIAGAIAGSATAVTAVDFKINGVQIFGSDTVVSANDADFALRDAINAKSQLTGIIADVDGANKLVLTGADGRNIHVETNAADDLTLGLADNDNDVTYGGTYKLTADAAFTVLDNAGAEHGFDGGGTGTLTANSAIVNLTVSTATLAGEAIFKIDNALRQVSSARSKLGALTNRLESTISNLSTVSENFSASDSRIRDADFAVETALLTRAQILQQAGVAILAQANMSPQAALSLLM